MKHIFCRPIFKRNPKEPKNKVDDDQTIVGSRKGAPRYRPEDVESMVYVKLTNRDPPEDVEPREGEMSFLLNLLDKSKSNSDQFTAVGIRGTAGSGKTVICQLMFNSPQVQKHFLPRIWVCMTKQPGDDRDPKVAVAENMLTCLGEDEEIIKEKWEENGISGLVSLLHRQLVGKRYLIVLDDAWDGDAWYQKLDLGFGYSAQHRPNEGKNFTWGESLAFGLPKGYGGAVIVNGRNDKVMEMMVGKENLYHLLPMTDEECWAIFAKASRVDLQRDPQVEELRRFVVQRAGGHPLTAKLIGQCYNTLQPAQQAADNRNVSTFEDTAILHANSSDGSGRNEFTELDTTNIAESQPADSSNGFSVAQVTGPDMDLVTALQPVNSGNGSSMEKFSGLDRAKVTALLSDDSSDGSYLADATGLDEEELTALQLINSGNDSSTEKFSGLDRAEVNAPLSVDSSNGSYLAEATGLDEEEVTAPEPADSSTG